MAFVSWIASEINANLCHIEREERWYKERNTAAISPAVPTSSSHHIARVSSDLNQSDSQVSQIFPADDITIRSYLRYNALLDKMKVVNECT